MTVAEEFSITVVLKEVNGFCEVIWSVSAEDVVEVSSVEETVFDVSEVAVLVVESVEESVDVAEKVDSDEDEEVVV